MKKLILSATCLTLLFASPVAQGAVLTVNTNADPDISTPDTCSLRQAVQAANTDSAVGNCGAGDPGLDEIEFANPDDVYSLTINPTSPNNDNSEGDLDICSDITVNGGGIGVTVIQAAFTVENDRVMQIFNNTGNPFGCFLVPNGVGGQGGNSSPIVTLNGVTIANGQSQGTFNGVFGGGGILNAGFLTINDSEITNNTVDNTISPDEDAFGGGILHLNTTIINRSLIHGNVVRSTSFDNDFFAAGGGVATASGDVSCFIDGCPLEITDTSVFNNTAENGAGGGIAQFGLGSELSDVLVLRSAVYDNQVTGFLGEPLAASNFGNGGGIAVLMDQSFDVASLRVVDSTLSGNSAVKDGGGLFEVSGDLTDTQVLSSTIANNSSAQSGGGIKIHRNSLPTGTIQMLNSILSGNASPLGPDCNTDDPSEPLTSVGFNLIFDNSTCDLDGAMTGDLPPGTDPLLGALADNGGLTPTHALTFGSPAIDTARDEADGGCVDNLVGGAALPFDQRNDPFARVVAGVVDGTPRCDMGAFEFQPTTITGAKTADAASVGTGDSLTYTLTVTNEGPGFANGVVLTDELPAETTFVSFGNISQGTCNQAGNVVTCDIGALASGASATVEINVTVAAECQELTNQGVITGESVDPANPVLTNSVVTPCSGGAFLLEGSGCSLQRGPAAGQVPSALAGILGAVLIGLASLRWRKSR